MQSDTVQSLISLLLLLVLSGCQGGITEEEVEKSYKAALAKWGEEWMAAEDKSKVEKSCYNLDMEAKNVGAIDWNDYISKARKSMGDQRVDKMLYRLENTSWNIGPLFSKKLRKAGVN